MKKYTWVLLLIILVKMIVQYILINPVYDLHRDEYLHLDMGRHLALGYISVPPFTSWIAWIIHALGDGVFWVKFFPALFGALTIVLVWKTVEILGGGLFARVLAAMAILLSVILRMNILFQPNSSDIFFWTLIYFIVIKYINTKNSNWFIAMGLAVGFGLLSKYNVVFLLAGIVPALVLSQHRHVFLKGRFHVGILIALLLVSPNIIWQIVNHFPTVAQLKELRETQLVNVRLGDFLKEQVLFFLNSFFILIAGFIGLAFYKPFRPYRFFILSFALSLLLFIVLKAKAYYAIGLYPVIIAFGSVYLEKLTAQNWRVPLRIAIGVVLVALIIPLFLIGFPTKTPEAIANNNQRYKDFGLLRWEDGKEHQLPQDFADMIGWRELAAKVDSVYATAPDKGSTLVLCDNYGEAGAINYYSRFQEIRAVSHNADYINWFPPEPYSKLILVKASYADSVLEHHPAGNWLPVYQGEVTNPLAIEYRTKIYLASKL